MHYHLPPGSIIAQFRDSVKAEYAYSHLKGIAASNLIVYKDKSAFDLRNANTGNAEPLKEGFLIDGLGGTEEKALIVVVPSSAVISSVNMFIQLMIT